MVLSLAGWCNVATVSSPASEDRLPGPGLGGRVDTNASAEGQAFCRLREWGWQMSNMIRLLIVVGLIACGIAVVAMGFARSDANLLAPVHLMLFVLAALVYVLPTGLAMYRGCKATVWIAVVNVLLGWTIFGWFVTLGWAAAGKMRPVSASIAPPPAHPAAGH